MPRNDPRNDPINRTVKGGQLRFYTHDDNLDDVLYVINDKITKLDAGESDPKIKANLIKIATKSFKTYIDNGGTLKRSIEVEQGRKVTAAELQEKLKQYQGR